MVREAIASDRLIGMVLLKEGWEGDYHLNPPICEIGCIGHILYTQPFEDGRFNIVLYGLSRILVRDQVFDRSYRQAWVEPFGRIQRPSNIPPLLRTELFALIHDYARLRNWQRQMKSVLELDLNDERLVNLFSAELDFTPIEKQFLLESDSLIKQAKRLRDLLSFTIQDRRALQGKMIPPPDPKRAS